MKLFLKLIAVTLVFLLAYCKSAKTVSAAASAETFVPNEKQMEIVAKRWPNTPIVEVSEGQNIFATKCTRCHGTKEITRFSEKKWLHEIDDMSPKAKLTPEEKLKLTKHILSYREANAPVTQN